MKRKKKERKKKKEEENQDKSQTGKLTGRAVIQKMKSL